MQQELASDYRQRSLPTEEAHERKTESCSSFFRILDVEYPKFFTMATLCFLIVFAYSMLREVKDTVVIGRMLPSSIQYLKTFAVPGVMFICVGIFFQYLISKGISMKRIMFGANVGFGIFFFLFATLVIKYMAELEPYMFWIADHFSDGKMLCKGKEYLNGLLLCANFWTGSLIYVAAELWGAMMITVMFFGCANEICPLKQALRFYPLFLIGANVGLTASGFLMCYMSNYLKKNPDYVNGVCRMILLFVTGICFLNVLLYRHLMKNIVPYPLYIISDGGAARKKKVKVGMLDGVKLMASTPVVLAMSACVLGYGMVTNVVEGVYKSAMLRSIMSKGQGKEEMVMFYESIQQMSVGVLTVFALLSPLKIFIQKRGWCSLGLISPVVMLIGSMVFFAIIWVNVSVTEIDVKNNLTVSLGNTLFGWSGYKGSLSHELWSGLAVVVLIKVLKYAAFDITKEAIGVKIPKEHRARFKGVYDGLCGKFGKSIASGLQVVLLGVLNTSDVRIAVLSLATFVACISLAWFYSALYLGKQYDLAVKEDRDLLVDVKDKKSKEVFA